ncbi:MAG TPA: MFS transporter [Candidatus Binatia bacterium]|nr:MFS transporter [Candidatus Binatia bacterium]
MQPLAKARANDEPGRARGPLGETWHAWAALAIGVLAVSAHSALSYGMSPLMKPITDELGWSRTEYATAMNLRMLVLMMLSPFAGQLVDRIGARLVLAAGALLMGMGTLGIAGIQSIRGLYGWNLVIGPGQACIGSVAGSALVLRLFRRRRGLAIGILNGGDNFITGGVHVASAALLVSAGWRGAIAALAAGYVALAVLVLAVLRSRDGEADAADGDGAAGAPATTAAGTRDPDGAMGPARGDEPGSPPGASLRDLPWGDPSLWLLVASYVLIYAYITTVGIHFPAFQRDLGRSADVAAYVYGLTTFIGAFGSVACGWIAERSSARATLSVVVAGLLASSVVLWTATGLGAYYAWAVGYGVVNAGAVALLALVLNELFGSGQIGRLMGVAITFCMAGTIAGNFFAAGMFDRFGSYDTVWKTHTALLAIALVPAELLRRRRVAG